MSGIAFSFAHVSKHFGDTKAAHDMTFTVREGEVVGFVGPNGAGKTTTISMLLGFIGVSQGNITIGSSTDSVTPSSSHEYHKDIGYVAGDMELFDNLTGKQYLSFLYARGSGDQAFQTELITRLQPVLGKRIKNLSRGNKQKIALIGALQHKPKLLVLDEPTSGLDPLMQDTFLAIISEHATRGATVFMSSHILSEVASACSRVLFMKDGAIIIDKPMADIERESGKRVVITASPSVIITAKKQLLAGARVLESSDSSVAFVYKGEFQMLLRWLATRPITDLSIEERSLDDIFKDRYKEGGEITK